MHWPRKINTREMLKETHAAEKFPTPPNTFLMVRFKCCFSMNIISVIQFVLKFSLAFPYLIHLSDGESYAHSFIPTPQPSKMYLV